MRTNQSAISSYQISSIYDEKGHGLLTCFVLKGIKNENEMRWEGSINISDLFGYDKPQIESIAGKQYSQNQQPPHLI